MLDFTRISNPIGPSGRARHAMRKAIRSVDKPAQTRFLTRYLCATEGVAEEELLLGNGASHILTLLLQLLTPKSALLPSPIPPAYEKMLQRQRVDIRYFPLNRGQGFALSLEEFKASWRDAGAAIVLNPHNPTGTLLPGELIRELIRTSEELGKPIIIDETLRDFTDNRSPAQQVVRTGQAVLLRSFSPYHALAGLRLGYAIGHPTLLSQLGQRMGPWPLNSLGPLAALASLRDKGYRKRTAEFLSAETVYALRKLKGVERVTPSTTPWGLFLQVTPRVPDLKNLFLAKGVLVEEYDDADQNQYLAMPFRSHHENARFFRVLQSLLRNKTEGRPLRQDDRHAKHD